MVVRYWWDRCGINVGDGEFLSPTLGGVHRSLRNGHSTEERCKTMGRRRKLYANAPNACLYVGQRAAVAVSPPAHPLSVHSSRAGGHFRKGLILQRPRWHLGGLRHLCLHLGIVCFGVSFLWAGYYPPPFSWLQGGIIQPYSVGCLSLTCSLTFL